MATWASDPIVVAISNNLVAAVLSDPVDLGVAASTLIITATHPSLGTFVVYDASLGGWQVGYGGTVLPDGLGGLDILINVFPVLAVGIWTIAWTVESNGGLVGTGNWSFTVNTPPVVTGLTPLPAPVVNGALVPVTFTTVDDAGVVEATIDLDITFDPLGVPVTDHAIINGLFQAGYAGTITPNGSNGFDVDVTTHPFFVTGNYEAYAYCEDAFGETDSTTWDWVCAVCSFTVVPTYLNLRVTFSFPMNNDAELVNPDNYRIRVTLPESVVDVEVLSVTPEDTTYPSYVDLTCTDCKNGAEYTLVIVPDVISSMVGVFVTTPSNEYTYNGVSDRPNVLYVQALSSTTVRVSFDKRMSTNESLKSPSSYVFTGGLKVRSVAIETVYSVILTTTEQTSGQIYDLTVG